MAAKNNNNNDSNYGRAGMSCPLCLEVYKDPVLLPCSHSVCRGCVKSMLFFNSSDEPEQQSSPKEKKVEGKASPQVTKSGLKCPICRREANVKSAEELSINYSLRDAVAEFLSHSDRSTPNRPVVSEEEKCDNDCEKKSEVECQDCKMAYCQPCYDSTHRAQKLKQHTVKKIAEKTKQAIVDVMCEEHAKKIKMYCKQCNKQVCGTCIMMGEHDGHARITIDQHHKEQGQKIEQIVGKMKVESGLMERMVKEMEAKMKQRDEEMTIGKQAVVKACDEVLKSVTDQIVAHRQAMIKKIDAATDEWKGKIQLQHTNMQRMKGTVEAAVKMYDKVDVAELEKQQKRGIETTSSQLEEQLKRVQQVTRNEKGEEKKAEKEGPLFRVDRTDKRIVYEGKQFMQVITAKEEVIQYKVEVGLQHAATIGKEGTKNGEFKNPWGLAVDKDGMMYVCDLGNKRVQKLNDKGQYITHYNLSANPRGAVVDNDGNMYVSLGDSGVEVWDNKGAKQRTIGGAGSPKPLSGATGVSLDAQGNVLVVDWKEGAVQVYTKAGVWVRQISSKGDKPDQLQNPQFAAVDKEGKLYVTDAVLNVIQVYDYKTGKHERKLGLPGQFNFPQGIAVTKEGQLVVAEGKGERIQVLEKERGECVTVWEKVGARFVGVAVTAKGVASCVGSLQQIEIFRLEEVKNLN